MLRHERMTVAMALAEFSHHSSGRQRMARAGVWGHEQNYTAKIRKPPVVRSCIRYWSGTEPRPNGSGLLVQLITGELAGGCETLEVTHRSPFSSSRAA